MQIVTGAVNQRKQVVKDGDKKMIIAIKQSRRRVRQFITISLPLTIIIDTHKICPSINKKKEKKYGFCSFCFVRFSPTISQNMASIWHTNKNAITLDLFQLDSKITKITNFVLEKFRGLVSFRKL